MYSPDELTPVYREMFDQITGLLPGEIVDRLRSSRGAFRHQSKTDMILFNIWDKFQTGIELNQFNYCLNHKPLRPEDDGHKWLLQLRCNIERIRFTYPEVRNEVRKTLRKLEKVCPKPFLYRENSQTLELRYTFSFVKPLSQFTGFIVPHFVALISATNVIYVEAVDRFHSVVPSLDIQARENLLPKPARNIRPELAIYSRPPTAKMKIEILRKHNHRCAHCGKPVAKGDLAFHHIKSVRDGGLRLAENFMPLHVACHVEVHRQIASA